MSSLRSLPRHLIAFVLFCFIAWRAPAQITSVSNDQATPIPGVGHDYVKSLSETVQPSNGQLSVRIDVPTRPGRDSMPLAYIYNSAGVHHVVATTPGNGLWVSDTADIRGQGWSQNYPNLTAIMRTASVNFPRYTASCVYFTSYIFQDPSGARHSLPLQVAQSNDGGSPNHCSQVGTSSTLSGGDGVYYATTTAPPPDTVPSQPTAVTVVGPDGTVYAFPVLSQVYVGWVTFFRGGGGAEDRNGNYVEQNPAVQFTPVTENVPWSNFSFNYVPQNNLHQADCFGISNGSGTLSEYQSINLPNGKSYQFQYDPVYGLLDKITYPTGGYVSYAWALDPLSENMQTLDSKGLTCTWAYDTPAISHRYVSFDGVNIALQQDFSYSTVWNGPNGGWGSKQTVVTTHDCARNNFSCSGAPSFTTTYNYTHLGDCIGCEVAVEQSVVYSDFSGKTLKTATKGWFDPYGLACELDTLDNGQISGAWYAYGLGEQVIDKKEYDYGLITSTTGCYSEGVPVTSPPSGVTPTRETAVTYQSFPPTPIFPSNNSIYDRPQTAINYSNGARVAETDFTYDQSAVAPVSPAPTNHDEANYPSTSGAPRGNATTITKQCFQGGQGCTSPISKYTFDETGQVLSKIDPCGNAACADITGSNHTTFYSYADSYTELSGGQNVHYTPSGNTNDFLTKITDPLGHTANFTYDYISGELTAATDANGLITSYLYNDPLQRLTQTTFPDGGQSYACYTDAGGSICSETGPPFQVYAQKPINSSTNLLNITVLDGLGHATQTQTSDSNQGTIYADTTYNGLGQVWKQSNPYRTGTDATTSSGTTTYLYDSLGRNQTTTYPDNSVLNTAYCGPSTLVTDPTKRWRRSRADGLGRLVEVDEPNAVGAVVNSNGCVGTGEPIWITSYGYDGLGNLSSVLQNGSHSRSFSYDSLSRLLTSTNPEVGALTYSYDANSNLSSKKDARSITITYGYDVLNRLKSKTYSSGDPTISVNYDESNCLGLAPCQNIGQRTSMTDAQGSEFWAYQVDPAHSQSVHANQRTTNSQTRTSTYYLDLAGNIKQIVYPTGHVVNYTYDNANRPSTATDGSNGITYATGFQTQPTGTTCVPTAVCYTPQGTPYAFSVGQSASFTGLNINETFNTRLQPNEIKASSTGGNAMDITYGYTDPSAGGNAGHIFSIAYNLDSTRSQSFSYDQLNRITSAQTNSTYSTSPSHCWGESYSLDAWSNLNSVVAINNSAYTGCSEEAGFSQTADGNNHLSGFSYDSAGNASSDAVNAYTWDGESQLASATQSGLATNYLYDGSGRRVAKAGSKLYWYGLGGEILSETDTAGGRINDYIFFAGKRVAALQAGIVNGGFEAGSYDWSLAGASIITDPARAHSGNNYVQLSAAPPSQQALAIQSSWIRVHPGQQVSFGGWVYTESGAANNTGWVLLVADANGHAFSFTSLDNPPLGVWTMRGGCCFTIPSGGYYAQMYCQIWQPTASTVVRCDDGFLNADGVTYYASDSLGTSRVVTDDTGIVCYDADFYPYGGERAYTNGCSPTYKFEGHERDAETGNDDFGARYYSNRFGRWLSADWSPVPVAVPYANLINPQTLNLYSMVSDDPESFADLDGHCCWDEIKGTLKGMAQSIYNQTVVPIGNANKVVIRAAGFDVGSNVAPVAPSNTSEAAGQAGVDRALPIAAALFGGGTSGSARAATEASSSEAALSTGASTVEKSQPESMSEGSIYRSGGSSPSNLTPRPGEALSFRNSLSDPIGPGTEPVFTKGEYIVVDTSKLPAGAAVVDHNPHGHVSVTATPAQVKAAIITKGKFPKTNTSATSSSTTTDNQ